jgi:hypothetical protein
VDWGGLHRRAHGGGKPCLAAQAPSATLACGSRSSTHCTSALRILLTVCSRLPGRCPAPFLLCVSSSSPAPAAPSRAPVLSPAATGPAQRTRRRIGGQRRAAPNSSSERCARALAGYSGAGCAHAQGRQRGRERARSREAARTAYRRGRAGAGARKTGLRCERQRARRPHVRRERERGPPHGPHGSGFARTWRSSWLTVIRKFVSIRTADATHLASKIRHTRQTRPCPCPLPVSRPAPPTSRLAAIKRGGNFEFDGLLPAHELNMRLCFGRIQ